MVHGDTVLALNLAVVVDFAVLLVILLVVTETDVDVASAVVITVGFLVVVDELGRMSGFAATRSSRSALTTVATPTGSTFGTFCVS